MPATAPYDYLNGPETPLDVARRQGRDAGYTDLGYDAPKGRYAADEFSEPTIKGARRPAAVRAPKPFDPLDDPEYKRAAQARKELHDNEQLYLQRVKDFDANEGKALKWKPDAATKLEYPDAQQTIMASQPLRLLAEKRQRLVDEAQRITSSRTKFDDQTFLPLRNQLMQRGAGLPDATPSDAPDYLAPEGDSPFASRVRDINLTRQRLGQSQLAPGSVSDGNFTERWGPISQPADAQAESAVRFEEPRDRSEEDGPAPPDDGDAPDALDEQASDANHAAMANDLKSKFARGSAMDRLKMMFGSEGYGNTPIEGAVPMIGSEVAGTKGGLFTIPKATGTDAISGMANAANAFTSGLTSPENVALMGATGGAGELAAAGGAIGKVAQAAKTAALGGFTAQMATGVPQQVKDAYSVIRDPKSTHADIAEAITTPGLSAFMTALAAHGTLGEGRTLLDKAGNETPPDYNATQDGRFTPQGPMQPGGMTQRTANMLRDTLVQTGKYTREDVSDMSDMEAHEALQAEMQGKEPPPRDIPPKLNIGGVSYTKVGEDRWIRGDRTPVEDKGTIDLLNGRQRVSEIANEERAKQDEPTPDEDAQPASDAPPVPEETAPPAEAPPAEEAPVDVGARDATVSDGSGVATPKEEAMIADWKQRIAAEQGVTQPISSETQPSETINQNEPEQLGTGSESQQPVVAERTAEIPVADEHGLNPQGRVESAGDGVRAGAVRPDSGGAGEQPRGNQGDGPESSGAGSGGSRNADDGHAGNAGVVTPEAPPKSGIISGSKAESWADEVLKRKRGQASSGLDPELLSAYAIKGAAHIERGVTDFAKWSTEMVKQFGSDVTEHLKDIWGKMHEFRGDPTALEKAIGGTSSDALGIKNDSVEVQRKALGLPPSEPRHGMTDEEGLQQATNILSKNKEAGAALVDKLESRPHAIEGVEDVLLTHEIRRTADARTAAKGVYDEALTGGDVDAIKSAKNELDKRQLAYERTMNVADAVGTKSSDSLRMRKMMLKEDYSPEELLRQAKRSNGGRPLSDEQKAQIEGLAEKYKQTLDEAEKRAAAAEQGRAEAEADLAIHKLTSKVAWEKKGPPSAPRAGILQSLIDRGSAAEARLIAKQRSGITRSSPLGLEDIGDYAQVVSGYIARGLKTGAELTSELVKKFGEGIRPHLPEIIKRGIEEHTKEFKAMAATGRDLKGERTSTVDAMRGRIAEGDPIGDLGHYVNKIAEQHIREGVKGREALLDAVHNSLKEIKPDITREEARDALSGYGKFKQLNPDPIKTELRDTKGQLQQVAKLQDMQQGSAPKKTGVERRVPSDEERRLIKQVEEAKKKGGYAVTDPAKQLKSSLDAIKTRLKNQINDLDFQISTGKKIIHEKGAVPHDPEAVKLVAERDALRAKYDSIFKKPELTDEQRLAIADKHIESEMNKIGHQLRTGELFTKGAKPGVSSPALEAKRARLAALKEEREYARHILQPKADPLTAQEVRMRALDAQIAGVEKQIKGGAVFDKTKTPTESTPEIAARKEKLAALKEERKNLRESIQPTDHEAIALQHYKAHLANRHATNLETLARQTAGDFTKAPKSASQVKLDAAAEAAKADVERQKKLIDSNRKKYEDAQRTWYEKGIDFIPKAGRLAVLSYPTVFTKLAAAAAARVGHSVMREGVISGLRQIPGLRGIAEKAPRFGSGFQLNAEVKAHTDGMMRAIRASGKYLKNKESDEAALYGGEKPDPEWTSYLGRLHGALKTPASMSEFERSYYKRSMRDAGHGLNPDDPAIRLQNSVAAYKDANRAIFMQDNKLAGVVKAVTTFLRRPAKGNAQPSLGGRIAAAAVDTELPITKVPANILSEVLENIHGPYTGAAKAVAAHLNGLDKLTPEASDEIMRQISNGLIGNALLLAGWYGYKNIGPTYQSGEKPRLKTLKDGDAMVGGVTIPKNLLHNPFFEAAQVGATAHHLVAPLDSKQPDDPSVGLSAAKSVLGLIEETPVVREMTDVSKMIERPEKAIPEHIAGRLVPGIVQTLARQMDKNSMGDVTQRKGRNFGEMLESGIPGLREQVPQKSYVDPAVTKQLSSSGLTLPALSRPRIGPPNKKVAVDDAGYLAFQKQSEEDIGNRLRNELPRLLAMPPERAQAIVNKIAEDARVKARVRLELEQRHRAEKH